MTNILLKTVITFFAIYGFVEILREVFSYFCHSDTNTDKFFIVIKVKDSEETLECTVRMIIWKCMSIAHGGFIPDILIVDMGSSDSTFQIAKQLCEDYAFIDYITYDDYVKNTKRE